MATILDNLLGLVSPAIVSALSRQTAESEYAVSNGLSAAIPAIASTMADRADDPGFMKDLADLATRTAAGPDPLEGISALGSSPTGMDKRTPIGGWLSSLFGRNQSVVTDRIAQYAGISRSSAASIISTAAPLVLGYIGRLMRSDRLTVTGLADVLLGQRAQLASSMPTGFYMPEVLRAPSETARTVVEERAGMGWSIPLVALLAALSVGGLMWWARQKPVEVARVDVVEPMSKPVGTTGMVAGKFVRTLPGKVTIIIPGAGSAEDRLSMYLASAAAGSKTINVDRITFDNDSAVLTQASNQQLDNIATILRAYPRANVAIAGHTDSVGREAANLALSRARANSVATRLKANGVSPARVQAAGFGSQKPVADNSTEAGRAQNRRVELGVTVR